MIGRGGKIKNFAAGVKRILVVEDEPAISQVCLRVLTGEGFEVDIASDGRIAHDMIEGKQYDLCLVGMRTPKMNGKELYRWLVKEYPQLVRRLIFTTGDMVGGDTDDFLEQAGRPVLPKPFTLDELKAIVRGTLKGIEE